MVTVYSKSWAKELQLAEPPAATATELSLHLMGRLDGSAKNISTLTLAVAVTQQKSPQGFHWGLLYSSTRSPGGVWHLHHSCNWSLRLLWRMTFSLGLVTSDSDAVLPCLLQQKCHWIISLMPAVLSKPYISDHAIQIIHCSNKSCNCCMLPNAYVHKNCDDKSAKNKADRALQVRAE